MTPKSPVDQWLEGLPLHLRDEAIPVLCAFLTEDDKVNFTVAAAALTPEGWGSVLAHALYVVTQSFVHRGASEEDVGPRIVASFEKGLDSLPAYMPIAKGPVN